MSKKGVYTLLEKVSFLNGEYLPAPATPSTGFVACGPGNKYCMEATLAQIAEVFFRVKEAKWVGGSFSHTYSYFPPDPDPPVTLTLTVTPPTSQPTQRVYELSANNDHIYRGFFDQAGDIVGKEDYFLASYAGVNGDMFADIGDDERAMWLDKTSNFDVQLSSNFGEFATYIQSLAGEGSPSFRGDFPTSKSKWDKGGVTAFSFWSTKNKGASSNHFSSDSLNFSKIHGSVKFSGNIGVVKLDPNHSIYASTNRFFIELGFDVGSFNSTPTGRAMGTQKRNALNPIACYYIIRLSDGVEIKCPIYHGSDETNFTDFIQEATEWWPYCKDKTEDPVWNASTGLKL